MSFIRSILVQFLGLFFPPRPSQGLVDRLSVMRLAELVHLQLVRSEKCEILTLFKYQTLPVRALVREAKFFGSVRAQKLLGTALATFLHSYIPLYIGINRHDGDRTANIVLIPLPLGPERLRERGYNQVERIAGFVVQLSSKPEMRPGNVRFSLRPELLERIRNTEPQTSLGRAERLRNMHGAFQAPYHLDPTYIYVLLDDVVTTGATFTAAAEALSTAGAQNLILVALAH
jgi:predicted amidophosphoribosyltransferase